MKSSPNTAGCFKIQPSHYIPQICRLPRPCDRFPVAVPAFTNLVPSRCLGFDSQNSRMRIWKANIWKDWGNWHGCILPGERSRQALAMGDFHLFYHTFRRGKRKKKNRFEFPFFNLNFLGEKKSAVLNFLF